MRMLIGADVAPNPNSGAAGTVWQMVEALRRRGHEVDTLWAADLGRRIRHGNLHYLFELPYSYRREVRRRVRKAEYDVIELNQPHACLAAADHRRSGRPGVFVNRSHGHEVRSEAALESWRREPGVARRSVIRRCASGLLRSLLNGQWHRIARDVDGFVVSCREDHDYIASYYGVPPARIGLITQGVPQSYLDRPPPAWSDRRQQAMIYIGQLAFFKAPQVLGRAVSQVLQARPTATMTWVCDGSHRDAALALIDEDVRGRVSVIDWMSQDRLLEVLDQHGIFLFPSYFEGFGKAPLEAMARGVCVIASSCGGMRDYIQHEENGLLVPIGQPDSMAQTAIALMENAEQCRRLSSAARVTALEHSWDRCAADAEVFYRRLLLMKKGAR